MNEDPGLHQILARRPRAWRGRMFAGDIIDFPHRGEWEMVMQSQVGAAIRLGDGTHAAEFRDLMHSVRRGDPLKLVSEPGKLGKRHAVPEDH